MQSNIFKTNRPNLHNKKIMKFINMQFERNSKYYLA